MRYVIIVDVRRRMFNGVLSVYLKTCMTCYELMRIKQLQNGTENKKLEKWRKSHLCATSLTIFHILTH